jgi:mannosyltransferase
MTSQGGTSPVGQTSADDAVRAEQDDGPAGNREQGVGVVTGVDSGIGPSTIDQAGRATTASREVTVAAPQSYDVGPIWALLLPPVATLLLCLWNITIPSYWRDEAATMAAVKRPYGEMFRMLGNVDAVHGAYYTLMWPLAHLFGTGEFVMRLPSVLAMAVTAAVVAAIGRRLVSPWVGLAAGLLFAVLPVTGRYGQDARSYAIVMAIATVASYVLIRVFSAEPRRRRRWFVAYGACLAALGLMNIFGLLLIPAHLVTVALRYRQMRGSQDARRLAIGWLLAVVCGVVISTPTLVFGWEQRGQIAWIANSGAASAAPVALVTLLGSGWVTLAIATVIAAAIMVRAQDAGARRTAWRWQLAELSLPWILVPPVLLVGTSLISPIFTTRYVLMCIPAVALLGGMALVALGRVAGPVGLAVVLLAGVTTQVAERTPSGHGDNIRGIDQIIRTDMHPGDVVLYTNPNSESFSAAYPYGLAQLPDVAIKEAADPSGTLAGTFVGRSTLRARLRQAPRVWVVEINNCLSEPQMVSLSALPQGPALVGLPLSFVNIWHRGADWLLLYKHVRHGPVIQDTRTACIGHL